MGRCSEASTLKYINIMRVVILLFGIDVYAILLEVGNVGKVAR